VDSLLITSLHCAVGHFIDFYKQFFLYTYCRLVDMQRVEKGRAPCFRFSAWCGLLNCCLHCSASFVCGVVWCGVVWCFNLVVNRFLNSVRHGSGVWVNYDCLSDSIAWQVKMLSSLFSIFCMWCGILDVLWFSC